MQRMASELTYKKYLFYLFVFSGLFLSTLIVWKAKTKKKSFFSNQTFCLFLIEPEMGVLDHSFPQNEV